jgi:hypothetical protein
MNRRATIVYVVLLLALVGAYLYLKNREQPVETEATAEPTVEVSYLFSAAEGTPSSIRVESKSGDTVEVVRDAECPVASRSKPADQRRRGGSSQVTTIRVLIASWVSIPIRAGSPRIHPNHKVYKRAE